jgi:hypothetical protein
VPIIVGAKSPSRSGLKAIYDVLFSIFKSAIENVCVQNDEKLEYKIALIRGSA